MQTIAVIDYGMGNLRSVSKAIEHVAPNDRVLVTHDPAAIAAAHRVVFPGQGAMPDCMREMRASGLSEAILAADAVPPLSAIARELEERFGRSLHPRELSELAVELPRLHEAALAIAREKGRGRQTTLELSGGAGLKPAVGPAKGKGKAKSGDVISGYRSPRLL